MPERLAADLVQRILADLELSDAEAEALAVTYGAVTRAVAEFPYAELRRVEPALRSVPPSDRL